MKRNNTAMTWKQQSDQSNCLSAANSTRQQLCGLRTAVKYNKIQSALTFGIYSCYIYNCYVLILQFTKNFVYLICICCTLGVFVVSYVYLLHFMCICCTMCLLLFLLQMPDCWLGVSIRKVLRPATSTQVFLGFPVSTSEC